MCMSRHLAQALALALPLIQLGLTSCFSKFPAAHSAFIPFCPIVYHWTSHVPHMSPPVGLPFHLCTCIGDIAPASLEPPGRSPHHIQIHCLYRSHGWTHQDRAWIPTRSSSTSTRSPRYSYIQLLDSFFWSLTRRTEAHHGDEEEGLHQTRISWEEAQIRTRGSTYRYSRMGTISWSHCCKGHWIWRPWPKPPAEVEDYSSCSLLEMISWSSALLLMMHITMTQRMAPQEARPLQEEIQQGPISWLGYFLHRRLEVLLHHVLPVWWHSWRVASSSPVLESPFWHAQFWATTASSFLQYGMFHWRPEALPEHLTFWLVLRQALQVFSLSPGLLPAGPSDLVQCPIGLTPERIGHIPWDNLIASSAVLALDEMDESWWIYIRYTGQCWFLSMDFFDAILHTMQQNWSLPNWISEDLADIINKEDMLIDIFTGSERSECSSYQFHRWFILASCIIFWAQAQG